MAKFHCAFIVLCSTLLFCVLSAKSTPRGLTLDLIHRDAQHSPLHEPTSSPFARVHKAIARSIARANRLTSLGIGVKSTRTESTYPEAGIISANGEYVMNISIGTPPFPILAIADTGSDLSWTQCKPCSHCYDQKTPLYDPKGSSTYKPVPCSVSQCSHAASGFNPSCDRSEKCQYSVAYGDQSTSNGAIATETVTFGSSSGGSAQFPNILFGCGFDNQGTFTASGSGIIGLGNGPDSLIGQIDKSIGGKFSYCLVPLSSKVTKSSEINFGKNAVVSGEGVVSTPLVRQDPATYYWLTIESITVGTEKVPYTNSYGGLALDVGNFIIDSGTTLFMLPQYMYFTVEAAVASQVDAKRAVDPSGQLRLCYAESEFKAPKFVVNFAGADVELNDYNIWVAIANGVVCFASAPSGMGIYGNLAQMNFLVGYDKKAMTVSFKPADCTN